MPAPHPALTEARLLGKTRYFTGNACVRGHVAERHTTNNTCVMCTAHRVSIWEKANPKRRAEATMRYANKPENKSKVKARYQAWCALNGERRRKTHKAWRNNNPDHVRAWVVSKTLAKRNAVPKWLTATQKLEIENLYRKSRELTASTGIVHHVDHIVPIVNSKVCGLHVPWNLRVITRSENSSKNNKLIESLAIDTEMQNG